jgi:hypothetical protein
MAGHEPETWGWETLHFHAGWRSRCLFRLPIKEGDRPILGVASAACSWTPSEADERLIAAAPTLLAASQALLSYHDGEYLGPEVEQMADRLRAAVAKATSPADAGRAGTGEEG